MCVCMCACVRACASARVRACVRALFFLVGSCFVFVVVVLCC